MRIVLIDKEEKQKIGGVGVYTTRFYKYLKDLGHTVFIFRFTKKKQQDKNIIEIPLYFAEERGLLVIPTEKTLQTIKENIIKINPDIVYLAIGMAPVFDFFIPALCHDFKIPIAGTWHADFNNTASAYQLLVKTVFVAYLPLVKQLDLLHVFSDKLANFYIDKGILRKRILVLPNGVDEKFYTPGKSAFARYHKIINGVLFLGRLTLQKNPEILIRSFLGINPPTNTKLILVGMGDKENYLRENYKDRRVIFTGAITDENRKLDLMRACQISVLPSRAEGMPLALLEAMSAGLACIASDAGSNSELLKDAGIVIPSTRMQQELPSALRMCLDYPEFISLLGKKAHQKVISEYSQETIFNRLIASLEKTIYDYQQRGSPRTTPIAINKRIGRKLISIFKKLENLVSLD